MAVYRFRVYIEDDHEVYRDIDVLGKQRFADLHRAVVEHFNFQQGQPVEYYSSDQQWYAGDTVVELDGNLEGDHQRIVDHITVPRQRFVCASVSYKDVELAIELQKVLKEEPGVKYPTCVRKEGDPPYYTQPPPEPIASEPEDEPTADADLDMFDQDGPSEEDIERIQKEAEEASKKADFKAPSIDFSKLGALSEDDDEETDDDDDDSNEDSEEGFEDFNMDDLM